MSYIQPFFIFFLLITFAQAKVIKIGITSVPLNLNPLHATDANSQNINRVTHISLIDFDQKMTSRCDACENFEEKIVSESSYSVFFKLKADLQFWDGSRVTSSDVEKSWKYFTNPQNKSVHSRAFENIKDFELVDNQNFRINFSKYSTENLTNLALLKIIKVLPNNKFIGAGSYKPGLITPLEVNLVPVKDITSPKLSFKVIKDETTLALKIMKKEVDINLGGISPRKYKWLKRKSTGYNFVEIPGTNYKYISFNNRSEVLSNKDIRKAIAHLIPREDVLKYKLHNTAVLSHGLFSPSFEDFFQKSQKIQFDPKASDRILKEHGYKKSEGYWTKNGKSLLLDWKVSNNKSTIEIVNVLKDYLSKYGIKINVTVQEWGTFMKNVKAGRFDIIMGQWIGFTGQDMMKFIWHSKSIPPKGANRGYYMNSSFDELIDVATTELNKEKRIELYKKAQRLAESDLPYLALWHPNITWIAHKCISGLKMYPNGGFLGLRNLKWECEKND